MWHVTAVRGFGRIRLGFIPRIRKLQIIPCKIYMADGNAAAFPAQGVYQVWLA